MKENDSISKSLNQEQLRFFRLLLEYEILYFDMNMIEEHIQHSFTNLNEILENLVHTKLLYRIERGKYALSTYKNIHVLATFISENSRVAYWSALHYHGLTDRFPNNLFIKTTQRKKDTEILGTTVQFVTVKANKMMGSITEGYGDDSFDITDVEMTFVDCFDQRRYAGGFPDLIKAFASARLDNKRLIAYSKAYNNIALIKRLGYLAELFHPDRLESFINYAQSRINERYNILDTNGMDAGEFNSEWKLRLNVSESDLLEMVEYTY